MWNLKNFRGEEVTWYSEKEYKGILDNLAEALKLLYNIDKLIKDESISDEGAILLIQRELKNGMCKLLNRE